MIDQYQPSQEKLPPVLGKNNYRDPYYIICIQGMIDLTALGLVRGPFLKNLACDSGDGPEQCRNMAGSDQKTRNPTGTVQTLGAPSPLV